MRNFLDDVRENGGYGALRDILNRMWNQGDRPRPDAGTETVEDGPPDEPEPWELRAYGTTLLGVLVGPDCLFWVQVGDGAMVKIVGGEAAYLVPPPPEAMANQTPSLCDDDAVHRLQAAAEPLTPRGVPSTLILATDGVPNSYDTQDGFFKFCRDIVQYVRDPADLQEKLGRWLPEISRQGSGDDMSVALAWATEEADAGATAAQVAPDEDATPPAGIRRSTPTATTEVRPRRRARRTRSRRFGSPPTSCRRAPATAGPRGRSPPPGRPPTARAERPHRPDSRHRTRRTRPMLSPHKDRVNRASGGAVRVGAELGTGGQGTVYEGTTDDGRKVAIKWYLPAFQNRGLRESIGELVAKKAPSRHFLWPDDLVVNGDEFGYIMRLRPPEFANLTAVLKRRVKLTFRELVVAASQTVSAFKELQATGLFYRDISDGNLFLNPRTGDVLICDNDNVGSSRTPNTVLGTARYMAPEIVRGRRGRRR